MAARQAAAANGFESIAQEWLAKRGKKSESGDRRLHAMLARDLYPYLGLVRVENANDYASINNALEPIGHMATETGADVLLVHHEGKDL